MPALDLGLPTKREHEYSTHVPALHDPYQVAVPADPGHLPPTANPYHDVPSQQQQQQQQPYGVLYPNQHQHQHHYAGAASYGLPFAANSHHAQPPNTGASANVNVNASLPSSNMPPRKAAAPPPPAPIIEPSPVRTKFPTARIKRIMQADEEVGKVAQQTPIAVGKALELFMIQLVSKSADVAKEKGSKRVTASMLKQVVETDDQWDFLRDIVSRVEHEKEGKAKAKAESESEEEEPEPKKRGRGGGRRKKS